jgi:hypothetical protein
VGVGTCLGAAADGGGVAALQQWEWGRRRRLQRVPFSCWRTSLAGGGGGGCLPGSCLPATSTSSSPLLSPPLLPFSYSPPLPSHLLRSGTYRAGG